MITMEYYENRAKGTVGSSRIRGDWLCKNSNGQIEKYGVGKHYDVLIFQKAYWEEMLKHYDGIKIFDICDPDWLEYRPVVEMINSCDGVVTSSEALADQIRKFDIHNKPVLCIPDRVDMEWSNPKKGKHVGQAKSCVYFGYSSNTHVLDSAVDSIARRGMQLTVISDSPYFRNDKFVKYDEETVNEEIIKHDIVVLPKAPSSDYRFQFKSNNKTIQSWALRMPVACNANDLDRLMDGEAREKEAEEKYQEVLAKWDVKHSVDEYLEFINLLTKRRQHV